MALAFLALAGAADVVSAVLRSMIIQFETPDRLRGRLMSIHTLVVTSGPRLGDAEAAAVAAVAGAQFSVVSGGILCLVGLLAVVHRFPQLLSYELASVATPGSRFYSVLAGTSTYSVLGIYGNSTKTRLSLLR